MSGVWKVFTAAYLHLLMFCFEEFQVDIAFNHLCMVYSEVLLVMIALLEFYI